MRGIARRLVSLEDRRRLRDGALGHLSDEELLRDGLGLILRTEEAGVELPADWQNLFNADPASFLRNLGTKLEESIECEG